MLALSPGENGSQTHRHHSSKTCRIPPSGRDAHGMLGLDPAPVTNRSFVHVGCPAAIPCIGSPSSVKCHACPRPLPYFAGHGNQRSSPGIPSAISSCSVLND